MLVLGLYCAVLCLYCACYRTDGGTFSPLSVSSMTKKPWHLEGEGEGEWRGNMENMKNMKGMESMESMKKVE